MIKLNKLISIALFSSVIVFAEVDHIDVSSRQVLLDGKSFGSAGSYEIITGQVYFRVKPEEQHNAVIVDLAGAKRNDHGEVEFSAHLWVLRPTLMEKGNGGMILEIPNRGRRTFLPGIDGGNALDPTKEIDWGDGWLLREGYTVGVLGWQWDLPQHPWIMRLIAPIAYNPDGSSIIGFLRNDFVLAEKSFDVPLAHILAGLVGGTEYAVSDPGDPHNTLTVRETPTGARHVIPRAEWSFGHTQKSGADPKNMMTDLRSIHLDSGFEPGQIYELVYAVQDPVVAGLSLAAVRDFVSYIKYEKNEIASVPRAYAFGVSQSGRFLRHFLYQGFNADEQGRQIFDGVMPQFAGAGRGSFNHRFAQPSRDASPMSAFFYPTDIFPFTDLPEKHPATATEAGLLDAARTAHVVPKIFYVNSSYEYWGRAASLTHTTLDASSDVELPTSTRSYFFSGLAHFPGPLPPVRNLFEIPEFKTQYLSNPNPNVWLWRAMISNMDAWVRDGTEPPPSAYPRMSDGTLVPLDKVGFPLIPGVRFPDDYSHAWSLDFGKAWDHGIIDQQPPVIVGSWPILLPRVDTDGNEIAGVHIPEMKVPLATYTGWNFRDPSIGAPQQRSSFIGSYFPFPLTRPQREASGDPRPSIGERYVDEDDYLKRYQAAADELVKARWLLPEDVHAVMTRAKQEWQVAQTTGESIR